MQHTTPTSARDMKLGLATAAYDADADEDDADARLALVKTANVRLQKAAPPAGGGDGYSALLSKFAGGAAPPPRRLQEEADDDDDDDVAVATAAVVPRDDLDDEAMAEHARQVRMAWLLRQELLLDGDDDAAPPAASAVAPPTRVPSRLISAALAAPRANPWRWRRPLESVRTMASPPGLHRPSTNSHSPSPRGIFERASVATPLPRSQSSAVPS